MQTSIDTSEDDVAFIERMKNSLPSPVKPSNEQELMQQLKRLLD